MVEFLVIAAIMAVVILFVLMAIPRGREEARLLGCRNNLFHIGVAIALYDQSCHALPAIGELAPPDTIAPGQATSAGPLRMLLETLGLPDLTELTDPTNANPPRAGVVPGEMPVPGFICASDPSATAGRFRAPISYRAVTGDQAAGVNGAFAPGRTLSLAQVEAADGLSFTAAFSERLVGDGQPGPARLNQYQIVPGPLALTGCSPTADPTSLRADAGCSWWLSDYRSTLYNHALPPNGMPSCITPDGKMAFMGAASGHTRGVNLLTFDGAVTLVRPSIDAKVWRGLAAIAPADTGHDNGLSPPDASRKQ